MAGVPVCCIYLDTGCSQTLERREHIPKGDIMAYRAQVCAWGCGEVPSGVCGSGCRGQEAKDKGWNGCELPVDVLLGTDMPELMGVFKCSRGYVW